MHIIIYPDNIELDTLSLINAIDSLSKDYQYLLMEIVTKLRQDFQENVLKDKENKFENKIGKTNQTINNIEKLIILKKTIKRKRSPIIS